MLTLLMLLILIYAFYRGYRRGLVMQVVRLIGFVIAMTIANRHYQPLARFISNFIPFPSVQQNTQMTFYDQATSFVIDQAFYRVVAYIAIVVAGWLVTEFISLFFRKLAFYEVFKWANHIGGGLISVLIAYIWIFFSLFTLSLVPLEGIQQQFVNNPIAYRVVSQTPVLSDMANRLWLQANPNNNNNNR